MTRFLLVSLAVVALLALSAAAGPALSGEAQRVILAAHNDVRSQFGLSPVRWSSRLATDASRYVSSSLFSQANAKGTAHETSELKRAARAGERVSAVTPGYECISDLAKTNSPTTRSCFNVIQGENIAMESSTAGKPSDAASPEKMYAMTVAWIEEKNHCPASGSRVGHFTEIVLPAVTEVGCGSTFKVNGKFKETWLVCRYNKIQSSSRCDRAASRTPALDGALCFGSQIKCLHSGQSCVDGRCLTRSRFSTIAAWRSYVGHLASGGSPSSSSSSSSNQSNQQQSNSGSSKKKQTNKQEKLPKAKKVKKAKSGGWWSKKKKTSKTTPASSSSSSPSSSSPSSGRTHKSTVPASAAGKRISVGNGPQVRVADGATTTTANGQRVTITKVANGFEVTTFYNYEQVDDDALATDSLVGDADALASSEFDNLGAEPSLM